MTLSRDEIQILAETHYSHEGMDSPPEASFAMLVDVAAHVYQQYLETDVPNIEEPSSFVPRTLGGVSQGWALIEGLIENLEMRFPDGEFRNMFPKRD